MQSNAFFDWDQCVLRIAAKKFEKGRRASRMAQASLQKIWRSGFT